MGLIQSVSEGMVEILQHLPLIVFCVMTLVTASMFVRNRWYKLYYLILFTPKCEAYRYCSENEFKLCSTSYGTMQTSFKQINHKGMNIMTQFNYTNNKFCFDIRDSGCLGDENMLLVYSENITEAYRWCEPTWSGSSYTSPTTCSLKSNYTVRCLTHGKNESICFDVPVSHSNCTRGGCTELKSTATRYENYVRDYFCFQNISFNMIAEFENLSALICDGGSRKQYEFRRLSMSSNGWNIFNKFNNKSKISATGFSYPVHSVWKNGKRTKRGDSSLFSSLSLASLISFSTGVDGAVEIWNKIYKLESLIQKLEFIVKNISNNQRTIWKNVMIDQSTISQILNDLKSQGLKLENSEKKFNYSHLCVYKYDSIEFFGIIHNHSMGSHHHNCDDLSLVDASIDSIINETKRAHEETLNSLRKAQLKEYFMQLHWEYPCVFLMIFIIIFSKILEPRINKHYHYFKDGELKCPYPHYLNKKGVCSCGKEYPSVKLVVCNIEKY
ncbi:glycoprotein precursor [andere Heimat virus 1]|uniref:Glycoprotein n=1 Tax=andere Heimat virus 1 TaxID=2847049 RepID=A0A6C0PIH1_9VIRU|nr:glycoprotein precursor [andere Heimat virus 1]QHX39767.1 glycoprotein precursor [andere Heimat virus 1]QHX39779.1 glycoprotein precursor [andere Heimat virus 1]